MSNNWFRKYFMTVYPWLIVTAVSLIALYVWAHSYNFKLSSITAYQFFPVLGLLGFSIMWSHYMVALIGRLFEIPDEQRTGQKKYYTYTGYLVLAAILLHPGILIYKRFRDGYGLPPASYKNYQGPMMAWVIMLGSISLLAFLAFELKRWYGQKAWFQYVIAAGDIAMIAIFYHGLRLGDQLQMGWFRDVWYFYGISLVIAILYKYYLKFTAIKLATTD